MNGSPFHGWNTAFFDVEWRVNGLWNTILAGTFPPSNVNGGYIISPEVYPKPGDTKGKRADLTVSKLENAGGNWAVSNPTLVYEGKGGKSKDDWDQISMQLYDWAREMQKYAVFNTWAIGSSGKEFRFYWFKDDNIYEVEWNNGNHTLQSTGNPRTLDLTNHADHGTLLAVLNFMKTTQA